MRLKTNNLKKSLLALIAFGFMMFAGTEASAQVTTPDSVCANTQDVVYGITGANPTSTYTWVLTDNSYGTIDSTIIAGTNDSIIQIDWGTTIGDVDLKVVETTIDGCLGDTMTLSINIRPLPTVALVGDTVCYNSTVAAVTFNFTGEAPHIFTYDIDGGSPITDTATASPHYININGTHTSTFTVNVLSVTDNNGCDADAGTLPSVSVVVRPKPISISNIYHY
ncbi:MAG: hypothetical protein SchgKO_07060 [Schleiferiaceae bacterium]